MQSSLSDSTLSIDQQGPCPDSRTNFCDTLVRQRGPLDAFAYFKLHRPCQSIVAPIPARIPPP